MKMRDPLHAGTLIKFATLPWLQKFLNPAIIRSLGETVPALAEAALKALAEHGKTLLPLISEQDMHSKAVPGVCR